MTASSRLSPPSAEQRPFSYERHGVTIDDPWAWLRDPGYPNVTDEDVLGYLKAENAFFEAWAEPHRELLDTSEFYRHLHYLEFNTFAEQTA